MGGLVPDQPSPTERVRLHITPFNPELLDRIIAPSVKPLASKISFHTVQTYPDRGFGYIELPAMEAQKLKKKLNGSTLKGAKVRIDDAKPEKKRKSDATEDEDKSERKRVKKEKRKREDGVLSGHELEEGRRVKRGWTEDGKDEKSKKTSRSKEPQAADPREGRKLRFKTKVPPNAMPVDSKEKKKQKKSKDGKKDRKVLVEESTKKRKLPKVNALGDAGAEAAVRYEDGVGWVDEAGEVVEPVRTSRRSKRSGVTQSVENSVVVAEAEEPVEQVEDEVMQDDNAHTAAEVEPNPASPQSDSPAAAAEQQTPPDSAKDVHPLEALFKRPAPAAVTTTTSPTSSIKPRPGPINTSFNFFNPEESKDVEAEAEAEAEVGAMPPQTPHTRQDMSWRGIRSAAPTPDTAAIGRRFSFPFAQQEHGEDEEEDEQDAETEDADQGAKAEEHGREGESVFRKFFYDNRGDSNRAWRKRRRDDRKVVRQRDNRRLNRNIA